ncbi:methylmalonic aciduria and homocystinuria type D homolog, mitochondrial [Diachasma alloeum]|uniref:methylmalonic aciduria and homocystinuria type D homolog, mitochondrial n=1 Tax=Diachasma alloeum TaxID=454923 RepID=UPI0007381B0C|nr:methylmalonic aciduria and homocystinuria type D homolog, mitochondrial [Diachasma alloeum]
MNCVKILRKDYLRPVNLILKAKYSRRSAKSTSSYKLIKSDGINADIENNEFDANPNWELFGPRGFRFYLPGSTGPGWLDQSTTAQVETRSIVICSDDEERNDKNQRDVKTSRNNDEPVLHCVAQECPILLRKGILELFPGCVEAASPQLTIVTITQKLNPRMARWSKETETERLAKFFLLAASDICTKLKMFGYWADFINPFSGQPYLNPYKNGTLYKTDERFRCLGFKVDKKNACKLISYENSGSQFIGSLYTTAPSSTEFLRDVMQGLSDH